MCHDSILDLIDVNFGIGLPVSGLTAVSCASSHFKYSDLRSAALLRERSLHHGAVYERPPDGDGVISCDEQNLSKGNGITHGTFEFLDSNRLPGFYPYLFSTSAYNRVH
jgi:hypothetical protein